MMAQRTVTGTITDESGEPLIGASILVKGTTTGTVTDIDGSYSVTVPEGSKTLVLTYTGFATQEVAIGASNVLDIKMSEDVEQLNEIVVTGLGIKKDKKALGYGVSTISTDLVENRNEADVGRILRGKAAGVDITQTSGLAGTGTNIIIRGYSSITGSNQPLFVVDGVPFNSDTNTDRGFVSGGATASSRFLDLDPNNIAEISILKGLSATVLYGEAGRNGVILVTTKNGNVGATANKGFEISFSQNIATTEVSNLPDYQNTYGNGFSGNFGWFFSNWGPAFDVRGSNGIDENGQIAHPYDQPQYNDDFPEFIGQRYDYAPYESVENFFDKGLVSNTSINIENNLGNGSAVSATYSFLNDEGFIPEDDEGNSTNFLRRHNFGLGGTTQLQNGLKVKATFNYVDSESQKPPAASGAGSNPSGASLFANLVYTPRSIDLLNLPYESPLDGSQVYYRRGSAIQNPLWTLNNARDLEDIRRFFSTIDLNYELTPWLNMQYRVGIDQYTQQTRREINRGGSQVPDGALATSNRLNRITDQVLNALYNFNLTDDLTLDGVVGVNLRREVRDQTFAVSSNQFVFDLFTHDNFIDHQNFSFFREKNNVGLYATATLGYKSYLYVNLQARNDWTSTLEKDNRSILYPSASVSFIPTEAFPALQGNTILNYLKLRAGYGTSAGYPLAYQTRNVLQTGANEFLNGGIPVNTNSVADRLGNPNLKPELHTEIEFGIEGRFLKNRVGVDLSYYNKQSTDLIIDLQLDPATGYSNTTVNAAEVENKGIELGLNLVPVKTKDFIWNITLNYTRNRNIVNKIADGINQFRIQATNDTAFGAADGTFDGVDNWAIPGEPYGTIQGTAYQKLNGEIVTGADGIPVPNQDISVIGDPNPDFQANWINSLSWKGLTLDFQWQYISGGDIYSITTATMLARGNTTDTDFDRFLPVIFPGVKADGTPNDVQAYIGDVSFRSYFFANEGSIFDATTIRLREIGLSYNIPASVLENTPFGSASLRFAGENLWYNAPNFPEGVNFDPEVISVGVGNRRGLEFVTGPTARKYGVNLALTF
jgi:TonB-linked SusC/RagA family outer membrane protein